MNSSFAGIYFLYERAFRLNKNINVGITKNYDQDDKIKELEINIESMNQLMEQVKKENET